jgi:hypothetical protein
MDLRDETGTEARFRAYAAELASVLGHADRVRPFEDYCVGLLSADGRKSVEPLSAVTAPERTAAQHQSLLHLVAQAPWSDQAVLNRVRERVVRSITRDEPIQAWIIDDTCFPKKGHYSVGVARQYRGQLDKQDDCQVAVRPSVATHQGSLPVAYRLDLPKDWATEHAKEGDDPVRRTALHAASRHLVRAPGRSDEDAMADRTRLSRTQAGGRARLLRRPRMARLSPPRKSLHRGLRISRLRKGDASPLRIFSRLARPAICRSPRLPTQRLCRCVHSAICQTRSQRYVSASHAPWLRSSHDAHAADGRVSGRSSKLSDAVGLRRLPRQGCGSDNHHGSSSSVADKQPFR